MNRICLSQSCKSSSRLNLDPVRLHNVVEDNPERVFDARRRRDAFSFDIEPRGIPSNFQLSTFNFQLFRPHLKAAVRPDPHRALRRLVRHRLFHRHGVERRRHGHRDNIAARWLVRLK